MRKSKKLIIRRIVNFLETHDFDDADLRAYERIIIGWSYVIDSRKRKTADALSPETQNGAIN